MTIFNHPNVPEFTYLTCCICQKEIDVVSFYAGYEEHKYYAHSPCFQKNREQGHSQRLTPSKFEFNRLKIMNPELKFTEI